MIPNSQILNSEVVNYSSLARTQGLILHTDVGIGYETPWRQVEAMLMMAAGRDARSAARAARRSCCRRRSAISPSPTSSTSTATTPQAMDALYTALHRNILDVFNEYGVQIMTPAYEGDPASPKLVPPSLWHMAPAPAGGLGRDDAFRREWRGDIVAARPEPPCRPHPGRHHRML